MLEVTTHLHKKRWKFVSEQTSKSTRRSYHQLSDDKNWNIWLRIVISNFNLVVTSFLRDEQV